MDPSNNESFTEDDENNLAYMFAQDVRLFIKYLGERCAKDPDNRVKYRWSDKQLEEVRNLYNSVSFHRRLCDYLGPQKQKKEKVLEIKVAPMPPSVVDEYIGERYPARSSSKRGKSLSPNRGRGKLAASARSQSFGKNPYPRVDEPSGRPSRPKTEPPLYLSPLSPVTQTWAETLLTVPEPISAQSWTFTENESCETIYRFEVTPPSPHLDVPATATSLSREHSFESGSSTTLEVPTRGPSPVELKHALSYGAVQFPQPQIPQFGSESFTRLPENNSSAAHSWENTYHVVNDQWMTSWQSTTPSYIEYVPEAESTTDVEGEAGPRDRKRKRDREETVGDSALAKKRRTDR